MQNSVLGWLNRIFLILADKNGKPCLTIDCRVINPNGPAKIRTKADDAKEQVCYFTMKASDKLYNTFFSKKILQTDSIHFQICRVLSRTKKSNKTTFSTTSELKDLLEKIGTSNIGPTIDRNYQKK